MKTANLAILFTDIKGFTERTGRQSYEENQRMLRIHDGLLMPVFAAFEGRLVKTIGDAFMVVFPSPTKAVLAGMAIQDRLWDYDRRVPESEQIHVRIAINMGEVRQEGGDVFGEPVNIASRVEGLAEAGEVLFTEAVFLAMNKAEVPAEEQGVHELKGIARPVRVYRVPRGSYELQGVQAPSGEGPPFGGQALARAGALPPADPQHLAARRELVPQLVAATSTLLHRAGELPRSLLAGQESLVAIPGARWLRGGSFSVRVAAGVLIAALGLGSWLALRGDEVERAISSGDLAGARAAVKRMPAGPSRFYDEGVVEYARGQFSSAADAWARAARAGEQRGFKHLVRMTRDDRCAARSSAARALGSLRDPGAGPALRSLENSSFADEGEDSALGTLFGCNSRRAAREALARLGAD